MATTEEKNKKKIMFSGGGTGGSVTPLLVIAEEMLKDDKDLEIIFVGTKDGIERKMVSDFGSAIKFLTLPSGKWRRYFSFNNILDIFKVGGAFFKSLYLLRKERPDVLAVAGGFVGVPLVWAAAFFRIPILVHQQDIRPGLANKLMAPFARVITVTFEKSLTDYGPRAVLTGNPTKNIFSSRTNIIETKRRYNLKTDLPLVLVAGGGTGALAINNLIAAALLNLLSFCQIINLTGLGKKPELSAEINSGSNKLAGAYQAFELVSNQDFLDLLAASDLAVSRCGLGALTEISGLAKAAILIPMPHSHQEDNALLFKEKKAAIVLNQDCLTAKNLSAEIKAVLEDSKLRGELSHNVFKIMKPDGARNIASIIWEMMKSKEKKENDDEK